MSVGRCCLDASRDTVFTETSGNSKWKGRKSSPGRSHRVLSPGVLCLPLTCPVGCALSPLLHLLRRSDIVPCSAYRSAAPPSQAPDPKEMARAEPDNGPVTRFFLRLPCQVVGRPWYYSTPDHQWSCEAGSLPPFPGLFPGQQGTERTVDFQFRVGSYEWG